MPSRRRVSGVARGAPLLSCFYHAGLYLVVLQRPSDAVVRADNLHIVILLIVSVLADVLQNVPFCLAKHGLLHDERPCFRARNVAFCKTPCRCMRRVLPAYSWREHSV